MARLLSVNVGKPKDVDWHGRSVHTGIWKSPVSGPVMARRLNLDGDGQGDLAGHGGEQRAVLVYQAESIAYWRGKRFGRTGGPSATQNRAPDDATHNTPDDTPDDPADDRAPDDAAAGKNDWGVFGENFTVEGLADDEVCIGDRYRIGEAEFEVTQPRVTCYRLGLRLDSPTLPSLLVAHGRPGFYLRVIKEGRVRAGEEITRTRRGPHALTVAEIDALLYLPDRDRGKLAAAVEIPALSPGWRKSFRDLLDDEHPADSSGTDTGAGTKAREGDASAAGAAPGWTGFQPLRVESVVAESETISSLWLAAPDGSALPPASPGQYLTLRVPGAGDPPPIRSYSLSSAPGSDEYRISVKREGTVSGYLHSNVHAGASIDAAAPRGEFVLESGTGPVVLISAGVGVTPVLAMLHQIAADEAAKADSAREVWWLHSAHNAAQQAFAREAHELLSGLPSAHELVFHTEADEASDAADAAPVTHTRLSTEVVAGLGLPPDTSAYICGPEGFMADMTKALVDAGLDPGAVHTELFGALTAINPGVKARAAVAPHPPESESDSGPLVTFVRSGLTVHWDAAAAPSLLELAEACDVPTRWSCRTGVCHTCVTTLLSGDTEYQPDPLEPPPSGQLLVCCARPDSDVILDL
jgi:ferredoxin-NADP reductase/MOSC domain-containing protein YiiM